MELQACPGEYRVEGEVGRFGFTLYEAYEASGEVIGRGREWFPLRQPREWHKTEGFREEALCLEASRRSYRDNTAHLNRYRRQCEGGTPVTTLRDNAQKEGARVLEFLEHHSQRVLADHGFESDAKELSKNNLYKFFIILYYSLYFLRVYFIVPFAMEFSLFNIQRIHFFSAYCNSFFVLMGIYTCFNV